MGTKPTYDINLRALDTRYKALQSKLHPDKFAKRCPREQGGGALSRRGHGDRG